MKQKSKITAAIFAAFFMGAVLAVAVVMPTVDAMEAERTARAERERIASEVEEAEAAWQRAYGQMTDEERLKGVVHEHE